MAFYVDETLPEEEQLRIFNEAVEHTRKTHFRTTYNKAIEMGASVEEATKLATENQDNFAL